MRSFERGYASMRRNMHNDQWQRELLFVASSLKCFFDPIRLRRDAIENDGALDDLISHTTALKRVLSTLVAEDIGGRKSFRMNPTGRLEFGDTANRRVRADDRLFQFFN